MAEHRQFNSVEFNAYVKFIKDNIGYTISNSYCKHLIAQAIRDNNYNISDVYEHLNQIMLETYPDYMVRLNNYDWRTVYSKYEGDSDLAPRLKEGLEIMGGRKDKTFYQDFFMETIAGMGINPDTMRIDMALDLFGWIWVLDLVVERAVTENYDGNFESFIKIIKPTPKRRKSKKKSDAETPTPAEVTVDSKPETEHVSKETSIVDETGAVEASKMEKTGKTVKETLVVYQLTPDKKFDKTKELGRYSTQSEICKAFGIAKSTLSNYMNGRKASMRGEVGGEKVRIGIMRIAA